MAYQPSEYFKNDGEATEASWHRFDLIPGATQEQTDRRRRGIKADIATWKLLGFKVDDDWTDGDNSVEVVVRNHPSWHPPHGVDADTFWASLFHARAGLVKESLALHGWGGGG